MNVVTVSVPIIHHHIKVLNNKVLESMIGASKGPGVVVEAEDELGEGLVFLTEHFAVVACHIVEFVAAPGGGAVINGGGNSRNRENTGAEDTFFADIIILISDGGPNLAGNEACSGTCG